MNNFNYPKKFLTTALPYANGNLHFGHFFEAIISDIFAKFNDIPLISGDDQHGAAITIFAAQNKLDLEKHLYHQHLDHLDQYQKIGVHFDHFGETHTSFHQQLVLYCYETLKQKNRIEFKPIQSWFDTQTQQFLPDRYVRGTCPNCNTPNVYPNICDHCGFHFKNEAIVNPISVLSQTPPVLKETTHAFLKTDDFYEYLEKTLNSDLICPSVQLKILDSHLKNNLSIDISRDTPYFGISLPETHFQQCFYVWFDAPIGYLSFALESINQKHYQQHQHFLSFDELVALIPTLEFHHVIGKDITYFHTYFWLNLLNCLDVPIVSKINTHGWITLDNGEKLSKSNGDKIDLSHFSSQQIDAIRLFFFSIYEDSIQDHVFNLETIQNQYNQVIVGKFFNAYSRISKIIENKLNGSIHTPTEPIKFIFKDSFESEIQNFNFKKAYQILIDWLNHLNQWIQDRQPWKESDPHRLNETCYFVIVQFQCLAHYIKIICPSSTGPLNALDFASIRHQIIQKPIPT